MAQFQPAPPLRRAAAAAAPAKPAVGEDALQKLAEERFPGGAVLKTDAEQQRLLVKAEELAQQGRFDLAAVLWQKVLVEAGDTLTTRDGRTYTSLAEQVERTLAKLPPVALETYRTTADAEAQALIAAAGAEKQEQALAQVVRRYFLSSGGDDAAYKLACLALDRHDFVGATRLLAKILANYPNPSIPKSEILLRLAVASAHMGDRNGAGQTLNQFTALAGPKPTSEIVDLIAADVKSASSSTGISGSASARDWHLALGNASRTGHMMGLAAAATSRTLSEWWVRELPLGAPPRTEPNAAPAAGGGRIPAGVIIRGRARIAPGFMESPPATREEMIAQWKAGSWRPTGRLLFDGGRVFLKTPDRLVCYAASAFRDQPLWQSAWENQYELDGASLQLAMMAMQMGWNLPQRLSRPKNVAEILYFGDRVHQSMALENGVIYSLEGKRVAATEQPKQAPAAVRNPQWGTTPRRTRGNWLTAYQASGGKALWTRAATDEEKDASSDVGFLAAPVPCGGLLLAPRTDAGTIWLVALDRATGKTVWKSYLCDEPPAGAAPWSEPVIAVDGREAYLTCGCGVVFAIDAAVGAVRWAVRYQRDGKQGSVMHNPFGNSPMATFEVNGWDDDLVIPYGQALIVMSSDSDKLLALDRRTGGVLWESPRTSPFGSVANYCVGTNSRGLFVAGKNVVRRYDMVSGRLVWEKEVENSFGRGCVTDDAIYLPVRDSILKLDLEKGRELGQVGVALTSDEPVGNLFSDGEKMWVVGAARVYALTTLEHRLKILDEQIAAGNAEAQLHRMRLYFRTDQLEPALADLRDAHELLKKQLPPAEASRQLLELIAELKLSHSHPIVTLQLLTELFAPAALPAQLGREAEAALGSLAAGSIGMIRQRKAAGAIPALLAVSPLLTEDYLLASAEHAADEVAREDDAATFLSALEQGPASARLVAMRAAARVAPEKAKTALASLLSNSDDRVRLAAARTIVNLQASKEVLKTLVSLLESANPRIRRRSYHTLQALTGEAIAFLPDAKPPERAGGLTAWQEWLQSKGDSAALRLPLDERAVPLGRILFVSQGQSTITELDADRKPSWQTKLPGPAWGCQGLPNGNRLVAIYSHSTVIEYDASGHEVWKKDRLPAMPYSVERLENGDTLVACADANQVIEIAPDGTTTAINVPGRPISAQRLESGNTLVALQQQMRVVEVERSGKIVWEARTNNPPGHAVRLENGNTLVCITNERKVVEIDPTGRNVVWASAVMLTNPYAAQRLANGNTLVADHMGVHEIDAAGKQIVWSERQSQVTGLSSF